MRRILILAAVLPVSACNLAFDVDDRVGTWRPIGANDANLRAMIADPADLVSGVGDNRADGQVVAAAVARYRTGKIKDLPDVSISKISPSPTNSPAAATPGTP